MGSVSLNLRSKILRIWSQQNFAHALIRNGHGTCKILLRLNLYSRGISYKKSKDHSCVTTFVLRALIWRCQWYNVLFYVCAVWEGLLTDEMLFSIFVWNETFLSVVLALYYLLKFFIKIWRKMVFKSSVSKHFFLKKYFLSIYTVVLPSNLTNEYFDNFFMATMYAKFVNWYYSALRLPPIIHSVLKYPHSEFHLNLMNTSSFTTHFCNKVYAVMLAVDRGVSPTILPGDIAGASLEVRRSAACTRWPHGQGDLSYWNIAKHDNASIYGESLSAYTHLCCIC